MRFLRGWGAGGTVVLTMLLASADARADELGARPRGTKIWVEPAIGAKPDVTDNAAHVLFLNRCQGGLTLSPGFPDDAANNVSSIIAGPLTLPEYPYGDASWNQIVADVQQIFAPFNIVVTDQDPSPMPHDEALVCGDSSSTPFFGAAGVAPFTCGQIENAITFTFPETIGNSERYTAEVIAQEAAHAWGLDHSYKCEDPMTYLEGCGEKNFVDGDFPCGEYSPRACDCGNATQNTYQHILGMFGPAAADLEAPTVSISAPSDGATFEAGADFQLSVDVADDVAVASVELFMDGASLATDAQAPFDGWPMSDSPLGTYEFYVRALDQAGNEGFSETITIHVTQDGEPDEPDDGGSSGGDDPEDDDAGDTEGSLPPTGVGFSDDQPETGCGCMVRGDDTPWFLGLLALFGVRRRRDFARA